MTAQIITFPTKAANEARLAVLAGALQQAVPLPNLDVELQLLLQMAERSLAQLDDSAALDGFLARLDIWDAQTG
ncbi:hypothetical protein C8J42_102546 [Sphingomonas sp. PP-CE-1A-559]|uniref:hypothetical protein n=1 Tax=Sphingomonas sp. PP-CE-1A-559 TaxID=2135657 RepID=UPI001055E40A|nr:hypothetical protein [Sphingomonas sp. PP-CE-1A-559]TCP92770.1 hypothetical protein C8J42_102546 [Sphingomonas sp. PP-CE-1A-559]